MNRFLLAAWLCVYCSVASAQSDDDPKKAWLEAASAGPSFAVQGEYTGSIRTDDGEIKVGVQIISQGRNKLKYAAYMGGLPGDGWDGNDPIRGDGYLDGSTGIVSSDAARGEIRDGSLFVSSRDGVRVAELTKVTRVSPTIGREPPTDAVVLFDGTTVEHFDNGRMSDDKLLIQGVTSKEKFQDFELHLEFMLSYMPNADSQARSNSGCYLQGRYEVQVLDSFGLTGENNECGGIYEISSPQLNMCFPPLSWQTYDIEYHAAKYDDAGTKTKNAWMTVKHNGVVVQDKVELPRATRAAPVGEGPEPGPVYLQDHGDPVRYRNIWVRPL